MRYTTLTALPFAKARAWERAARLGSSERPSALCFRYLPKEKGRAGKTFPHIARAIKACKSRRDMMCVFPGCLAAQLAILKDPQLPSVMDKHPAGSNLDGETSRFFWAAAHKVARGEPYVGLDEAGLAEACRSLLSELFAISGRKRVIFSLEDADPICNKRIVDGGTVFQEFLDALLVVPSGLFGIFLDIFSMVHNFCPKKSYTRAVSRGRQPAVPFPLFSCLSTHGILELSEALSSVDRVTHPRRESHFAGFLPCSYFVVSEARPSFAARVRGKLGISTTAEGRSALLARVIPTASRKLGLGAAAVAAEASRSGPRATCPWSLSALASDYRVWTAPAWPTSWQTAWQRRLPYCQTL